MNQARLFLKGMVARYAIILLMILSVIVSIPAFLQTQDDPCKHRLPQAFKTIKQISSEAPWVFEESSRGWQAMNELNNSRGEFKVGPISIRLDDGSQGTVSAEQAPCKRGQTCSPFDCACFEVDSYWIHVRGTEGKKVADLHFWAAYDYFRVVPVDLVDGPGDELLIFTINGRGSPRGDDVMQVWKLGGKPVPLADLIPVSGKFSYCVPWRDRVYVSNSVKPHKLILKRDVAADPCCVYKAGYDPELWPAKIKWEKIFSFSPKTSKYKE
jgi:hypothetical protein